MQTGRYAWKLGYYSVPSSEAVPLAVDLLPAALRRVGYRTHAVGKWVSAASGRVPAAPPPPLALAPHARAYSTHPDWQLRPAVVRLDPSGDRLDQIAGTWPRAAACVIWV